MTREQYLQQVLAACEFLQGECQEMLQQLEMEMKKASSALNFEMAAELRDMIADLRRSTQKTEKFERIPYKLPVAINPEDDLADLGQALGLPVLPHRIEGFDISNISGTFAVASLVSFKNGRPDRANYRRFKMKTVVGQDDFACMAEAVRRRYSRLLREATEFTGERIEEDRPIVEELRTLMERPWEAREKRGKGEEGKAPEPKSSFSPFLLFPAAAASMSNSASLSSQQPSTLPDLIVIDGGKGQLNAACEELAKLGLSHISVIGLAKEFEEIYRPGEVQPLRLSQNSGALKLLQRVRDESHRVANSYNAQLRIKRVSESMLDEFPGIGPARKAALLKRFGSVQRLRTATVEQIAEVPGFGGKAAAELKAFLEARSVPESPQA